MKMRRILLIRDEVDGVESDNMQRDETISVLDAGMKKGGEESKAAARCGVRGSGAGSSLLWQSVDFRPPVLTSGLDFSAHIHLFNLRQLHLMSSIVHRVKEQWMPLYSIVPP
ncbi:Hypothetical predicted protein [Xyrichtys novacula]|uniref:Uncharacterized protein n=1 Tax=Xyrichtys novacula TaxID=13765 RepID=A0AAV1EYM6_XYRNO|nr:Hypothetical predicted protein [Xyrichtys novacula]